MMMMTGFLMEWLCCYTDPPTNYVIRRLWRLLFHYMVWLRMEDNIDAFKIAKLLRVIVHLEKLF